MMNIAIVTASIGQGHNSVALALEEKIKSDYKYQVKVFDILEDSRISQILKSVYLELVTKTPYLYSKMYQWSQRHTRVSSLTNYFNFLCLKSLKSITGSFKPDVFIFTHSFPTLSYSPSLKVPAWAVITDYAYHPIWFNPKLHGYFVANRNIKNVLVKNGYQQHLIYESGIPIKDRFFNTKPTKMQSTKPNISSPLILIMGGGLGLGPLSEIVEELNSLDDSFQSIVLTGKNEELYNHLNTTFNNKRFNRWRALSFTDAISDFMQQADLLITKGGAITLTEAMASNLPTIIYKPIAGHEEENAKFVCKQQWATWAETTEDLLGTTQQLLSSPKHLSFMRQKAAEHSNPLSTSEILEVIINDFQINNRRISL